MESTVNEFDSTPVFVQNVNTTETLRPQPIEAAKELFQYNLNEEKPTLEKLTNETESELQKIENAALNVVHSIEEKMEIVEEKIVAEAKAVEGYLVDTVKKSIHVHVTAGGGSIIRNPG